MLEGAGRLLKVTCRPSRWKLREWICDVVLRDWLGQDFELQPDPAASSWHISHPAAAGSLVLPDILMDCSDEAWLSPASLPRLPLGQWPLPPELALSGLPRELPVLYGSLLPDRSWLHVSQPGEGLNAELGIDLLGSCVFLLGRYAEYCNPSLDGLGRVLPESSLLGPAGLLQRPLANEYAELLWKLLRGLWPQLQRPARSARLIPTHDIDNPLGVAGQPTFKILRDCLEDVALRHDPALALRRWNSRRQLANEHPSADPLFNFDWMMEQSERHGLSCRFYFLVDDSRFSLDAPWVAPLLRRIHERRHLIGLHPPTGSMDDQIKLADCSARFRAVLAAAGLTSLASGQLSGRQHLFQWRAPDSWQGYAAAGIQLDSSCYFPQQAGFRCGSCWSFQPCDLQRAEALLLREEPTIAMEVSLLSRRYAGLSLKAAAERMLSLAAACTAVNGDFILLWHNEHLISRNQQAAYCHVLNTWSGMQGSAG